MVIIKGLNALWKYYKITDFQKQNRPGYFYKKPARNDRSI